MMPFRLVYLILLIKDEIRDVPQGDALILPLGELHRAIWQS